MIYNYFFVNFNSLYKVERPICSCFAARVGDRPASISFKAEFSLSLSKIGRPGCLPLKRAALMPSLVRSAINLLSKCAIAPNT